MGEPGQYVKIDGEYKKRNGVYLRYNAAGECDDCCPDGTCHVIGCLSVPEGTPGATELNCDCAQVIYCGVVETPDPVPNVPNSDSSTVAVNNQDDGLISIEQLDGATFDLLASVNADFTTNGGSTAANPGWATSSALAQARVGPMVFRAALDTTAFGRIGTSTAPGGTPLWGPNIGVSGQSAVAMETCRPDGFGGSITESETTNGSGNISRSQFCAPIAFPLTCNLAITASLTVTLAVVLIDEASCTYRVTATLTGRVEYTATDSTQNNATCAITNTAPTGGENFTLVETCDIDFDCAGVTVDLGTNAAGGSFSDAFLDYSSNASGSVATSITGTAAVARCSTASAAAANA